MDFRQNQKNSKWWKKAVFFILTPLMTSVMPDIWRKCASHCDLQKIGGLLSCHSQLVQKLLNKNSKKTFPQIVNLCFIPFPGSDEKNSSAVRNSKEGAKYD